MMLRSCDLPPGFWGIDFCLNVHVTSVRKSVLTTQSPSTPLPPITGISADGWRGDSFTTHFYQVYYGLLTFNFIHDLLGVLTVMTILSFDLVDTLCFNPI